MVLVRLDKVTKSFGGVEVLSGCTWQIDAGQRIGMVGENGAGKTTLFRLLTGEYTSEAGMVTLHRGIRIGMLSQQPELDLSVSAVEGILRSRPELSDLEARIERLAGLISEPESDPRGRTVDQLLEQHSRALDQYGQMGGHDFEARICRTLAGLGLPPDHHHIPTRHLSGGQKSRVALAKVLLDDVDLLLLDEPTNHLDITAIEWLQGFLRTFSGAFVVISHDRYFLDAVCTKITEIEDGGLKDYSGNYSTYAMTKENDLATQAKAFELQQKEIRRQEDWIRWRMQQGTEKAVRMAQSRARLLAKIERIERPTLRRRRAVLKFAQPRCRSADIVDITGLAKTYGERTLFSGLDLLINNGNRIGIVGPNGTGKSTLLKIVMGEVSPTAGRARLGPTVRVGYYAQDREDLDLDRTILEHVQFARPDLTIQDIRTFLARFLFFGDMPMLPVGVLSGGERSRVALALLILRQPDFLILDEPTNHLDIPSREVFEDALVDYTGTILVASHDRYFLDRTVETLLLMEPDGFEFFRGNYSALTAAREEERRLAEEAEAERKAAARRAQRPAARSSKPKANGSGNGSKRERLEQIEGRIIAAEARIEEVAQLLSDASTYEDGEAAKSLTQEYEALTSGLQELYEMYEEAG